MTWTTSGHLVCGFDLLAAEVDGNVVEDGTGSGGYNLCKFTVYFRSLVTYRVSNILHALIIG